MPAREDTYVVQNAIRFLAEQCDYAETQDFAGFSATDANMGHFLACAPEDVWSDDVVIAAAALARKYRRQLQRGGFDIEAIDRAAETDDIDRDLLHWAANRGRRQIALRSSNNPDAGFLVSFQYGEEAFDELKRAIKAVGGRFDRTTKAWRVPADAAADLKDLAHHYQFVFADDDVADVLQRAEHTDQTTYRHPANGRGHRGYTIEPDPDNELVLVKSPYDRNVVADVKAYDGARFDRPTASWQVPAMSVRPEDLEAFAGKHGFFIHIDTDDLMARLRDRQIERDRALERMMTSYIKPDRGDPDPRWRIDWDPDIQRLRLHLPSPGSSEPAWAAKEKIKGIGGIFDKDDLSWKLAPGTTPKATLETLVELQATYGFLIHEDVPGVLEVRQDAVNEAYDLSSAAHADIDVPGLTGRMRPFQRAGVAYTRLNPQTFIADDMGLGKTIQALATVEDQDAFPAIILCPASVVRNWQREAQAWLPHRTAAMLQGTTRRARQQASAQGLYDADIIVAGYETGVAHQNELAALKAPAVILDEGHAIKNHKAKRTQAAHAIGNGARVKLVLTGTPILNRPAELIEPLTFIDKLDDLGGFWTFATRYCGATTGRYGVEMGDARNLDELNEQLRGIGFVRRRKSDVLDDLPAKQRQIVDTPIPADALKRHNRAAADAVTYAAQVATEEAKIEAEADRWNLSGDERDRFIAAQRDAARLRTARAELLQSINFCRQIAGEGKADQAADFLHDIAQCGESAVLFTAHRAPLDRIEQRLREQGVTTCRVTGNEDGQSRQTAIDRFQNGDVQVFLGTIAAAGQGITLTRASYAVFLEQAWRPADHDQAEDRLHRIGQTNAVNVYYLLDNRTIDAHMHELVTEKRAVIEQGTGDQPRSGPGDLMTIARKMSDKDLVDDAPEPRSENEKMLTQ